MVDCKTMGQTEQRCKETGSSDRRPIPGWLKTKRMETNISAVKAEIDEDANKSQADIARSLSLTPKDVSCIVRKDLGMKSRAMARVELLNAAQGHKRLDYCTKILNILKKGLGRFSSLAMKKIFTIDVMGNSRMNRYIAKRPKDVPVSVQYQECSKHPTNAGIVGSNGMAFPLVWIKGDIGSTPIQIYISPFHLSSVGQDLQCWELDLDPGCPPPVHTAKDIQFYLEQRLGSKGSWSKEMWALSSPNLNPLDYHV